jgi:prepilin-type N-terminal cleavage/methylation domain-containing protein
MKAIKYSMLSDDRGFGMVELLVVIVVIAIMASIAMQSMTAVLQDERATKTERELEGLAKAIVGDPGLTQANQRCDFGYVGDVGAFPPNLQALYQNSIGFATWEGPYLPPGYAQDSTGFKTDEWGALYSYSGGTTISSTGGGSPISKKIAAAADDYLLNTVNGTILDAANEPPGAVYADSIDIVITYPNGAGSMSSKTYQPTSSGDFTLDSIPVGAHLLRLIYTPEVDTITRYLTVLPRHRSQPSYRFASAHFGGGGGGGGGGDSLMYVAGSATNGGAHNDHMSFDIRNTSGSSITINSIVAAYTSSPASFYGEFKWDGTKLWKDDNDQRGTGEILNFGDQILGAGDAVTIELKRFREPRNGNTKFDIRDTEFTVTFSNGDAVTFTVPAI